MHKLLYCGLFRFLRLRQISMRLLGDRGCHDMGVGLQVRVVACVVYQSTGSRDFRWFGGVVLSMI